MSVSNDNTLENHTHDLSPHRYIKSKVFSKPMTIPFILPLSPICETTKTSVNIKHIQNWKTYGSQISVDVHSSFFEDVTPCRLVNNRIDQKICWQCMDTRLFIVNTNKLCLDSTVLLSHWLSTHHPTRRTYHITGQTFFLSCSYQPVPFVISHRVTTVSTARSTLSL